MRIELAVEKLLDATRDRATKPEKLARIMELTFNKVAESGPVGDSARRLVEARMLRSALRREFKIKRLRGGGMKKVRAKAE